MVLSVYGGLTPCNRGIIIAMESSVAELRGARDKCPHFRSKYFHFHAVFSKKLQYNRLANLPWEFGAPPLGNPGSATDHH